jgi:hypothetical protein
MTTSGSIDFTLTAGDVVEEAFKLLGIKPAEQTLQDFESQDGLRTLNLMLKSWQAQGLHLWAAEEGIVFLESSKSKYLLGSDRATRADDFIGVTLTSAAISTATTLALDSSGMAIGDQIGVELDDGTRHWTTIATVPDSISVTITLGLTAAAASGNSVYTYTTILERPLRIKDYIRRQTFGQNNEIEITKFSRQGYFTQTDKTSAGTVTGVYYSPQLTNGELYVWQPVNTITELLRFTFERSIEDIDDSTNTLDIPVEWLETVIYNLAARLADSYTSPKGQTITAKAQFFLDELLGWDEEDNIMKVEP